MRGRSSAARTRACAGICTVLARGPVRPRAERLCARKSPGRTTVRPKVAGPNDCALESRWAERLCALKLTARSNDPQQGARMAAVLWVHPVIRCNDSSAATLRGAVGPASESRSAARPCARKSPGRTTVRPKVAPLQPFAREVLAHRSKTFTRASLEGVQLSAKASAGRPGPTQRDNAAPRQTLAIPKQGC